MTSPLALITAAIVAWLVIGGAGIVQPRNLRVVRLLFMKLIRPMCWSRWWCRS